MELAALREVDNQCQLDFFTPFRLSLYIIHMRAVRPCLCCRNYFQITSKYALTLGIPEKKSNKNDRKWERPSRSTENRPSLLPLSHQRLNSSIVSVKISFEC